MRSTGPPGTNRVIAKIRMVIPRNVGITNAKRRKKYDSIYNLLLVYCPLLGGIGEEESGPKWCISIP
jgi:hypothetical protein